MGYPCKEGIEHGDEVDRGKRCAGDDTPGTTHEAEQSISRNSDVAKCCIDALTRKPKQGESKPPPNPD